MGFELIRRRQHALTELTVCLDRIRAIVSDLEPDEWESALDGLAELREEQMPSVNPDWLNIKWLGHTESFYTKPDGVEELAVFNER
jgi:hypothetical protein